MDSTLSTLKLAIEVATSNRDHFGQILAQMHQQEKAAYNRLEQLQHYKNETDSFWMQRTVMPSILMNTHVQFTQRLHEVEQTQIQMLQLHKEKTESARKDLVSAEQKLATLQHLFKNHLKELEHKRQKREQQHMDEIATQGFIRRAKKLQKNCVAISM